jgi:hypothetical protein
MNEYTIEVSQKQSTQKDDYDILEEFMNDELIKKQYGD